MIQATEDDLAILNDKVIRLAERNDALEKALMTLRELVKSIKELRNMSGDMVTIERISKILIDYEIEGFE